MHIVCSHLLCNQVKLKEEKKQKEKNTNHKDEIKTQNTVAIALECMDMGSIYDSCFAKPAAANILNKTAQEQECGNEQIQVDKLLLKQLIVIATHSLLGLNALHNCNPPLLHGDIKPQNILSCSFGQVKIAHFGLLKPVDKDTLTLTDSKGTQKYFIPERIKGEYGIKSDV